MEFNKFYKLGQEKIILDITAREYDIIAPLYNIRDPSFEKTFDDLNNKIKKVRETAKLKAGEIKIPDGFWDKMAFNLGYFSNPPKYINGNHIRSGLPVNPFTGKNFY